MTYAHYHRPYSDLHLLRFGTPVSLVLLLRKTWCVCTLEAMLPFHTMSCCASANNDDTRISTRRYDFGNGSGTWRQYKGGTSIRRVYIKQCQFYTVRAAPFTFDRSGSLWG